MLLYASTSSRQSSLPLIGRKSLLWTLIHIAHCTIISISLRHHPTQLLSPLRTEKSLTPGKGGEPTELYCGRSGSRMLWLWCVS